MENTGRRESIVEDNDRENATHDVDNNDSNDNNNDNNDNNNDPDNEPNNREDMDRDGYRIATVDHDNDDSIVNTDSASWSDDDAPYPSSIHPPLSSMSAFSPEALARLHSHCMGHMGYPSHVQSDGDDDSNDGGGNYVNDGDGNGSHGENGTLNIGNTLHSGSNNNGSNNSDNHSSGNHNIGMGTIYLSPIQPLTNDEEERPTEEDDEDEDDGIFGDLLSEEDSPHNHHHSSLRGSYSQNSSRNPPGGRVPVDVPPRSPLIDPSLRSYLSRHSPNPGPSPGSGAGE